MSDTVWAQGEVGGRPMLRTNGGVTLGSVTKPLGLTARAVRFYEERGLVSPCRDMNGRRIFSLEDRSRLRLIAILRSIGLRLDDIGAVFETGADRNANVRAIPLVAKRVAELEVELNRVREVLDQLAEAPAS
jgi:DNA-binding transcriptional MerR regulator